MDKTIPGIHHLTAIASDPQRNLDFYTGALGLRLVKLTVNFDDPGTYHFYFGDGQGRPGTILTFFPWPSAPQGQRGTGEVTTIGFAVPEGALGYWAERLQRYGVSAAGPEQRFDEQVLSFTDPDGMQLELVARRRAALHNGWAEGAVPAEFAIRGFSGVTLSEIDHEDTAPLLSQVMGFRPTRQEGHRFRYEVGEGADKAFVDIVEEPETLRGRLAAGSVHHIAWRTSNDEQQLAWRQELLNQGLHVTAVRDRQYFHSIYFHEPGGVLFEIATDPPGFATDETPDQLGTHLKLPSWLEPERSRLEGVLPRLRLSGLPVEQ
ncbi:MAG TPA: ring-cleaving dioxygenase [Ktedonobacterales bacterium]|nr:ring-cleaving dioxygenase [Ktedonobacterales bacterium]